MASATASSSSSSSRILGKALFVWNEHETMNDNVMVVIDLMKTEFIRRGINVSDNEDEEDYNISIIFVTKDFLIDHCCDFRGNGKYRIKAHFSSAIIIDDDERKFADFVHRCKEWNFEEEGDDDEYLIHYDICSDDVMDTLGPFMYYPQVKSRTFVPRVSCRTIIPGISPGSVDEIQAFAVDYAEEALHIFNHMGSGGSRNRGERK